LKFLSQETNKIADISDGMVKTLVISHSFLLPWQSRPLILASHATIWNKDHVIKFWPRGFGKNCGLTWKNVKAFFCVFLSGIINYG
jgi:hypothetical protein